MNTKLFLGLLIFCLSLGEAKAQESGVLALKEKGVVIRSFTAGSYINFQLSGNQWVTAYIDWIRNDSVQVKQFALQTGLTAFGTYGQDTLKLGRLAFHKSEILALSKPKGYYNSVFTNGGVFKAAGIGYIGLNIANSLIKKEPVFESKNIPGLIGGAASWVVGKIIKKSNPNYCPIGKRYSIVIF
jgi:hypothetical protein